MRYEKGTIQISPARDIPLLQQVLRSGFATSDQLYEFMQLNQSERSRQAFDHRLRRLLAHGLIEKHQRRRARTTAGVRHQQGRCVPAHRCRRIVCGTNWYGDR